MHIFHIKIFFIKIFYEVLLITQLLPDKCLIINLYKKIRDKIYEFNLHFYFIIHLFNSIILIYNIRLILKKNFK